MMIKMRHHPHHLHFDPQAIPKSGPPASVPDKKPAGPITYNITGVRCFANCYETVRVKVVSDIPPTKLHEYFDFSPYQSTLKTVQPNLDANTLDALVPSDYQLGLTSNVNQMYVIAGNLPVEKEEPRQPTQSTTFERHVPRRFRSRIVPGTRW